MGKGNVSNEFKHDAVARITEQVHPIADGSQRFGPSAHSLLARKRKFAAASSGKTVKDEEIERLKRDQTRSSRLAYRWKPVSAPKH